MTPPPLPLHATINHGVAYLRDANSDVIAIFRDPRNCDYILSLFNTIDQLEEEVTELELDKDLP